MADLSGRTTSLFQSDPFYTWAGAATVTAGGQSSRLVQVTLDTPRTLSWAVYVSPRGNQTSPPYDLTRLTGVEARVSAGVSRGLIESDWAVVPGAAAGQAVASQLLIDVRPTSALAPPWDTYNVVAVVGEGNAAQRAFPADAQVWQVGGVARADQGPAWRNGVIIRCDPTNPGYLAVILGNRSGPPQLQKVAPGETLALPGYQGSFGVVAAAGGVGWVTAY